MYTKRVVCLECFLYTHQGLEEIYSELSSAVVSKVIVHPLVSLRLLRTVSLDFIELVVVSWQGQGGAGWCMSASFVHCNMAWPVWQDEVVIQ